MNDDLQIAEVIDADTDRLNRQDDLELRQATQLDFLLTVLRSIHESNCNPDIIYLLLRQNLDLIDVEIIEVLRNWVTDRFAEIDRDEQRSIAMDVGNFGNLIQQLPFGNEAINIELSIECYSTVLRACSRIDSPTEWSITQNSLGHVHRKRIQGDRAKNLERAIECYGAGLEVHTQTDFPVDWAMAQHHLANTYRDRIQGDRANNLEHAIEFYGAALKVYTQSDFPVDWASIQNDMAIAYSIRIQGEQAENLEYAIECYGAALKVYTQSDFPMDWALIQNNLALAYKDRVKGDRSEYIERAIEYYGAALTVYTQTNFPINWATIQNNLASTYSIRIQGERTGNFERTIECYGSALEVYTAELFPSEWAMIQVNLARFSIEQLQHYQFATEHLQNAYAQLLESNNDTGLLAKTMFELARCFHKTGCLGQAKIYFKDSIRLYQRLEQPTQVAAVTSALGNLELQMGQIDDARIHLQTALSFYQAAGNLDRVASIQELQQCLPEYSPEPAI